MPISFCLKSLSFETTEHMYLHIKIIILLKKNGAYNRNRLQKHTNINHKFITTNNLKHNNPHL